MNVQKSHRAFWIGLAVIVVAAAVLRLYALGDYPQEFNQDEMVFGYDAWSIWHTGRDQHGELLPIYFRSFNDYVPGVAMYITAPIVGLLGLDEAHTRLSVALLGVASVFVTGLTGRRWFSPAAGLVAAGLLAIDPWHINYSRIAFPASMVPFFTIAALYTFTKALNKLDAKARSGWAWLTASALSFALLGGVYPTMKLQSPLLIATCLLAAFVWFRRRPKVAAIWLALVLVFASPFIIDHLLRWDLLQKRFENVSGVAQQDWFIQFWKNYAGHYNPAALFFNGGYGGGVGIYPNGEGLLFWLQGVFWLGALGAFAGGEERRPLPYYLPALVGLWFITFPIASSLTTPSPHEIRAYNFLPLPELLSGFGAVYLWKRLNKVHRALGYAAALSTVALAAFFVVVFCRTYFAPLMRKAAIAGDVVPANIGLREALDFVNPQVDRCDTIWIEPPPEAYVYYLFLTPYPPERFQAAKIEKNPDLWLHIKWFENVRLGVPWTWEQFPPVLPGCEGKPSRLFYFSFDDYAPPEYKEIYAVRTDGGLALWRAFVVDPSPSGTG